MRVAAIPDKADAVLIIDADRVLAFAVAGECFKLISRWNAQVTQFDGCVQDQESLDRYPPQIRRDALALSRLLQQLGVGVLEPCDHVLILTDHVIIGKRY